MKTLIKTARGAWWTALALAAWMAGTNRAAAQARPGPPALLTFRGSLVAPDGSPIGGSSGASYPIVFRIFDDDRAGRLLWTEQQTVSVLNGQFTVLLGEGSTYANEPRPLLSTVFQSATASDRFLEVTVRATGGGGQDATVTPRTRLTSGVFGLVAGRARTAETLVNGAGQPMLVSVGDRVGVNQANPRANLDVPNDLLGRGLDVRGDLSMGGLVEASGFDGIGMAPVGSILMWTGATPPKGWVLCDGTEVAGVKTPDLRGRFVLGSGKGEGLTERQPMEVGGKEAHALTEAEIPSHSHSVSFSAESAPLDSGMHHYRIANQGYRPLVIGAHQWSHLNQFIGWANSGFGGGHEHRFTMPGFTSGPGGEGRPHNTMPPFYVLAFIMRVQ